MNAWDGVDSQEELFASIDDLESEMFATYRHYMELAAQMDDFMEMMEHHEWKAAWIAHQGKKFGQNDD